MHLLIGIAVFIGLCVSAVLGSIMRVIIIFILFGFVYMNWPAVKGFVEGNSATANARISDWLKEHTPPK